MEAGEDTEVAAPEHDRAGRPRLEKRWPVSCSFPTCPDPVPSTASLTRNRGARPSVPGPGAAISTARKDFARWQADRLPRTIQSAGRDYVRRKVDVTACPAGGGGRMGVS